MLRAPRFTRACADRGCCWPASVPLGSILSATRSDRYLDRFAALALAAVGSPMRLASLSSASKQSYRSQGLRRRLLH